MKKVLLIEVEKERNFLRRKIEIRAIRSDRQEICGICVPFGTGLGKGDLMMVNRLLSCLRSIKFIIYNVHSSLS